MAKKVKVKKRIDKKNRLKAIEKAELSQKDQSLQKSAPSFDGLHIALLNEVFRLKKRLSTATKENVNIASLSKAIERMENVFLEYNYEIIDHTGREYDEQAIFDEPRFVQSDEVSSEKGIITKVIYPQINYNNKAIKHARIEISKKNGI